MNSAPIKVIAFTGAVPTGLRLKFGANVPHAARPLLNFRRLRGQIELVA